MPRNDAKRTNNNTKRLPNLVKITNIKKKRSNNRNKNKNQLNTTTYNSKQQQQRRATAKQKRSNIVDETKSWINLNQTNNNNSGDTDAANCLQPPQASPASAGGGGRRKLYKTIDTTTLTTCQQQTASESKTLSGELITDRRLQERGISVTASQAAAQRNKKILKYFNKFKYYKISSQTEKEEPKEKIETISNCFQSANTDFYKTNNLDDINNKNNKNADTENIVVVNNNSYHIKTEETVSTATVSSSSSSLTASLSSSSSPHHCPSTLYPIVIETHISETQSSLPGDLNNTKTTSFSISTTTTTTTTTATDKTAAAAPATTKHSTTFNVACCNSKAAATAALYTTTTTTAAAVDTLLEHQKHQQKFQKKRHRKRQHFHHSQEVKARLATLRTRKVIVANDNDNDKTQEKGHNKQEQQQQLEEKKEEGVKKNVFEKNPTDEANTNKLKSSIRDNSVTLKEDRAETPFSKRVFPQVFDEATLNRIETLSDNEVKKPNSKRKRNQTATLLQGLNNIQPARSKRISQTAAAAAAAAAAATLQIAVVAPPATVSGDNNKHNKHQSPAQAVETAVSAAEHKESRRQLSLSRDFLKPLPVEAVNTNSKKRPRIMSLYERPYQTANDGRGSGGSVVGNGYMSTSRSSSSGGGGGVGGVGSVAALVMSDSNDSQELANQYYLSGTSGSGIAGNSSTSVLLGNGSAINHAPTMGTLCNIGNTCYLNSVVYTLRFAPQFLHNLHHLLADLNALQQNIARARAKSSSLGRGISAVHMENARSWSSKDLASMEQYNTSAVGGISNAAAVPGSASSAVTAASALTHVTQKSSHQMLTEKLHDLYQSLYRNEMSESTEPHHADTLLHAIQDVSTIFEGNQQQDAHEFLMCLLNSIRETSQTLLKAIAECPDVILNGYIANPDDSERDLKHSNVVGGSGGGGLIGGSSNITGSNMSVTSALSSLTSNSKTSLFFSRKSKRKDETKNSKNTRLQSPLKDNQIPGGGGTLATQSNSLFYLNANDLNSSSASTSPPSVAGVVSGGVTSLITSPSNSTSAAAVGCGGGDDVDNSSSLALLLKDKQRLECKIRELGLDFFNEDFEGITVSTTKCLSCETVTEQKETMIDIAVPVPQAGYESNEFTDRPSSFIQNSCITREYFRNENKYRCEQCCGYTEAIRSISYEVLPRLLIIQLSRFSGGMEKINSYIPTSFTLQCFCSKCCELSDANKLHIYKLYSVITHVGATMSVGHYIAYTCSLDWANEYINCPKEQKRRASQERAAAAAAAALGANGGGNGTALGPHGTVGSQSSSTNVLSLGSSNSTSSSSSSTTSLMKIIKFGRNKASSSGDMSKNVKHINGLTSSSKAITNGIGKLTMNNCSGGGGVGGSSTTTTSQCSTTCQSINCCAMRLTAQQQLHYLHTSQTTNASDFSESEAATGYTNSSSTVYNAANYNNNMQQPYTTTSSGGTTSGYGSTGRGATKASYASQNHNGTEPIWYMCDDDKIKAMTQREFEELLSPARKITITPYLLFYARYNLQTSSSSPPKSTSAATMSSSSPSGPVTSSPQASWSNESLQSSGHSAHSSGMRM